MDYTHEAFARVLAAVIDAGYETRTLSQACSQPPTSPLFIVRHDVEWELPRTLAITDLEEKFGIDSSLYVRLDTPVYQPAILRRLQSTGFEIGYHYNTLDRCGGDFAAAAQLFRDDLRRMRDDGLVVRSVIPHGDPRVKKSGYRINSDLIDRYPELYQEMRLIDVATELPRRYPNHTYVRDLGIRWNKASSSQQLVRYLRAQEWPVLYMLTHPDYWSKTAIRAAGLQVAARMIRALPVNQAVAMVRSWLPSRTR